MTLDSEPLAALEAARARVIAQTERARAAAADAARLADDVRTLSSSASSPRREVTVTARPDGAVERIDLAPQALELDAAALSRLLTETVQQAQQDAAAEALTRMRRTLGDDSPLMAEVRAQVAARAPRGTDIR